MATGRRQALQTVQSPSRQAALPSPARPGPGRLPQAGGTVNSGPRSRFHSIDGGEVRRRWPEHRKRVHRQQWAACLAS
ncbi:MAG: hypothetical protein OXF20_06985 [Gammaproteobacteria bacterium]|nr:hypothetical protein [Gammaproteobacteria bacterium]